MPGLLRGTNGSSCADVMALNGSDMPQVRSFSPSGFRLGGGTFNSLLGLGLRLLGILLRLGLHLLLSILRSLLSLGLSLGHSLLGLRLSFFRCFLRLTGSSLLASVDRLGTRCGLRSSLRRSSGFS